MRIAPQISGAGIVARGHFNPLIFRPDWFNSKEILVGADYDNVKIEIIHPEIVNFNLPWGAMQVDQETFSITCVQEPHIRVHDFFVKCFQNLPETPISALGINVEVHFEAGSEEACDRVGDTLAPKEFWGDFVKKDGKKFGGLRTLIIEQSANSGEGRFVRQDGAKGWLRVQVEPSLRVTYGIYVRVNDHYDLLDGQSLADGRKAAELVASKWDSSIGSSEKLIDKLMELASGS